MRFFIKRVLVFFCIISTSYFVLAQQESPALKATLERGIPENAKVTVPSSTFSISPEEQAEIDRYKNTPCGKRLGWVKGRDNLKLYKECEREAFKESGINVLKVVGIMLGIGAFALLFLSNLGRRR